MARFSEVCCNLMLCISLRGKPRVIFYLQDASTEAREFLSMLLKRDPADRATATQALRHSVRSCYHCTCMQGIAKSGFEVADSALATGR
jgi:serine/threonine protein kinase